MAASFTVLASGSSGNASLVRSQSFGLLIDIGVGPRSLALRLAQAGLAWNHVNAVVLTHTHGDHWSERSLGQLHARRLPLFCHDSHRRALLACSRAFAALDAAGLVATYEESRPFAAGGGLRVEALKVSHDSHQTFAFRVEDSIGDWRLGYAADLGEYCGRVAEMLCGVDVLALEFNHDEGLLRSSGRPRDLIDRILGPGGHLSNHQGAELLASVIRADGRVRPRTVLPLHLSRECNRPIHAADAAQRVLAAAGYDAEVVVTAQGHPAATVALSTADRTECAPQSASLDRIATDLFG